jgi:hypothetical protein
MTAKRSTYAPSTVRCGETIICGCGYAMYEGERYAFANGYPVCSDQCAREQAAKGDRR